MTLFKDIKPGEHFVLNHQVFEKTVSYEKTFHIGKRTVNAKYIGDLEEDEVKDEWMEDYPREVYIDQDREVIKAKQKGEKE